MRVFMTVYLQGPVCGCCGRVRVCERARLRGACSDQFASQEGKLEMLLHQWGVELKRFAKILPFLTATDDRMDVARIQANNAFLLDLLERLVPSTAEVELHSTIRMWRAHAWAADPTTVF